MTECNKYCEGQRVSHTRNGKGREIFVATILDVEWDEGSRRYEYVLDNDHWCREDQIIGVVGEDFA